MNNQERHSLPAQRREEILNSIRAHLQSCSSVLFAFVHGSFLEEQLSFMDIDIAVFFDDRNIQDDLLDLCLELSAHLSSLVHFPVDVHALNDSSIGFRHEATSGKLLLTKDEDNSFEFMEKTWMEYFDLKPFLKENLRDLLHT
ncbi:MAG: nucleotidyltransferase domain-containing protein [Bacillota bacterium]